MRVGFGYDLHELVQGKGGLWIGGWRWDVEFETVAHSDGDVILHATIDAILGSLALGDIGEYFPDRDPTLRGAASRVMVKKVLALIELEGWQLHQVDTTLVLEKPKIQPFKSEVIEKMSEILGLEENCIGFKAKSSEGLGEIGRGEAIAAYAVATVVKRDAHLQHAQP